MFAEPLVVSPSEHTMGRSLLPYLELKIPPALRNTKAIDEITVQPKYDFHTSARHWVKNGKLTNYIRPTWELLGNRAFINCFPGFDYIFHFSSLFASYYQLLDRPVPVNPIYPTEQECREALSRTLEGVPARETFIVGKIDELGLAPETPWSQNGDFIWKQISDNENVHLLGCRHTLWGDISARLVRLLAKRGTKRVVYVGKLGSLDTADRPSDVIATGQTSLLVDGSIVGWANFFSDLGGDVRQGRHATLPSVLQETHAWLEGAKRSGIRFVDPEIGMMAKAASEMGVQFSYLHIVSDNLIHRYSLDLSNERTRLAVRKRAALYPQIGEIIMELSQRL